MNTKKRRRPICRQNGQIELLAAMLVVATMAVIGYVFFLVDTGVSAFYKQRLQFLTAQGATYAANYKGADPQSATRAFLQDLASKMGLQTSQLNVTLTDTVVNGQPSYACNATATLPLLAGSVFPANVTLSGTSTAPKPGGTPQILVLAIFGVGNRFNAPNATVTGTAFGVGNFVTSAKSSSSGSGASGGNNVNAGIANAGSGINAGVGNIGTGTGINAGVGNINTGSGVNAGVGNINTGSGNTLGVGNVWN